MARKEYFLNISAQNEKDYIEEKIKSVISGIFVVNKKSGCKKLLSEQPFEENSAESND